MIKIKYLLLYGTILRSGEYTMKFIIILTLCLNLYAKSSPNKRVVANTMLTQMNKNGYMNKIIKDLAKQQISQNPMLRLNEKLVTSFVLKYASFNKLKPQLAALYAKELTIDEMKTFTDFVKSKAGQKILLKMPRLIQISSYVGEKTLQKHYPELINAAMR
jgi:hypothetical protein